MPRLISGGAHGADGCFERCAVAKGHGVCIISFKEHNVTAIDPKNVVQLTHNALEKCALQLEHVGEIISKNVPTGGYTRWLLLRNIVVATKADCMFAVISDTLKPTKGLFIGVPGGTGWTTQCFAMEYMHLQQTLEKSTATLFRIPLWVFDGAYRWHRLIFSTHSGFYWEVLNEGDIPSIPKHAVYAGVGSREFSAKQQAAVESLFAET